MVGVIGAQTFGLSDGEQVVVGTDERQRRIAAVDQILVERPGSRQLYCIVGTQWMPVCHLSRRVYDHRLHIQDVVTVREIIVKNGRVDGDLLATTCPRAGGEQKCRHLR